MENLKNYLFESTIETMENMAFMEVRPGRYYWASLMVEKPETGLITISFPEQLARRLTESLLGMPRSQQKDEDLPDSMGELINTIGGLLMSKINGENELFKLGLPDKGFGKPDLPDDTVSDSYEIDGEMFHVFISGGAGLSRLADQAKETGHTSQVGDEWGAAEAAQDAVDDDDGW